MIREREMSNWRREVNVKLEERGGRMEGR